MGWLLMNLRMSWIWNLKFFYQRSNQLKMKNQALFEVVGENQNQGEGN
jgi:hypothetical protein